MICLFWVWSSHKVSDHVWSRASIISPDRYESWSRVRPHNTPLMPHGIAYITLYLGQWPLSLWWLVMTYDQRHCDYDWTDNLPWNGDGDLLMNLRNSFAAIFTASAEGELVGPCKRQNCHGINTKKFNWLITNYMMDHVN